MERNYEIMLTKAIDILGSRCVAEEWLEHMSRTLDGKPIDIGMTPEGLIAVLQHLNGISRHSLF